MASVHYQQGQVDDQGNLHAPVGGVSIGGKFFAGGKFITKEDLKSASPQELQMLKLQFAGDPKAEKVLGDLANGQSDEPDDQETRSQEALASRWGKPLQVDTGNFLIRQVMSLKNAGFNVDITATDKADQVRQAVNQLNQMAPVMEEFLKASDALGFTRSKAQGLVARVNNATHNIFKKAESLGWNGTGTFKERFQDASQFLIARGDADARLNKLKGDVAEAALRLASRVLKVPLAKAFGGRFSGNPQTELGEASAFLQSLRESIHQDDDLVPAESGDEPNMGDSSSWDAVPNYDPELRRLMADALGLDDVSPAGYAGNMKILQEAHQKATANFYATHGSIANAVGVKNLKGMAREAKEALAGGSFRGISSLVAAVEKASPGAIDAISGGEADKGKSLIKWLAGAPKLRPPAMNSPETVELYRDHPAVAGLRDYMAAQSQGLEESDEGSDQAQQPSAVNSAGGADEPDNDSSSVGGSAGEVGSPDESAQEPKNFTDLENYSYEDHATLRDATGMDLSPQDYEFLAPYLDEAHKMALQEYQDTHGALKNAIGGRQLAGLRRRAKQLLKPGKKTGKVGDAADFRGFDLVLDRVKSNAAGALDAIRGQEDESTALMEWLAEGSTTVAPKRDAPRVADLLASNPDVQRYLDGDIEQEDLFEGDEDDLEAVPFSKRGRRVEYSQPRLA